MAFARTIHFSPTKFSILPLGSVSPLIDLSTDSFFYVQESIKYIT